MKIRNFILLMTLLIVTVSSQAQVSVNVNVGTPPVWAPAAPPATKYYYIPDIETYYDVPAQRYIYLKNGKWHRSASLPAQYRGYDLRKGRTVYLTSYKGNAPYKYYKNHKIKYKGHGHHGKGHGKAKKGHGHKKGND
ncbi:hypothetical protein [Flavobacterium sp. UBA7682]|uniref:hypothetical protein n=1 Tax=Flavobacterium sp. UBA7682 TaxID=1946560 RepID=UPI0025C59A4B|nr:hypothetical protein [Flavobacterium sp. UBA7682]